MSPLLLALAGCAPVAVQDAPPRPAIAVGAAPTQNLRNGCVADYRPGTDYFPQKAAFTHSAQLRVSYHGHYKRVTFTPAVDTRETLRMVLVQCGTPAPTLARGEVLVEVPVRSFATANVSLLGASVLLGVADRLKGIPTSRTSLPQIRRQLDDGTTASVYAAEHGNGEQAAAQGADLYFTFYSAYPDANVHPLLKRMGVAAAPQSDHSEPTPLGRAEWIKYLGLFVNGEAQANALFADRKRRYLALAEMTRDVTRRPLVQAGYPETRDAWAQAGGGNAAYRLIEDAGGRHAWHDVASTGSLTYAPMEKLFDRAGDADVWIGSFATGAASMAELRRDRPRLAWLRPVRGGRVWWLDRGRTDTASAAWTDQGMTEPQDALADLIAVLHPELLPGHTPRFLRRIPGGPA